jgi:hypothetical protein
MADAERNTLKTDHIESARNERSTAARQPGATGKPARELSPDEARREAENRLGKTAKHAGPPEDADAGQEPGD